ncbi:Phospholipase/carboxylesterase/thioesterase [Rhodocollybia butyracea]|uniref:Acyl-protein thioesterase 1 n=1 Tax=Rhodocollybia butyracea TaxID=206335 RepID=A0A9P5PHK8_9AGAR|nr:Phospholipase/carboxylesterase/thioesterase [Rhodocollybia butyracea]
MDKKRCDLRLATALQFITVPAVKKHTATVIFVHVSAVLGDTGYGWHPVATMFQKDHSLEHVKFVLPHSPEAPVTANMGIVMPFVVNAEDEAGILKSRASLIQLIDAEIAAGTPPNRIVLGGFSQGASMSLFTSLSLDKQLAGVVCLSGWILIKTTFQKPHACPAFDPLPIFWGHGSADPLVKPKFAEESIDWLKSIGIRSLSGLSYTFYPGVGHSTNMQELEDLKVWIAKVIPERV